MFPHSQLHSSTLEQAPPEEDEDDESDTYKPPSDGSRSTSDGEYGGRQSVPNVARKTRASRSGTSVSSMSLFLNETLMQNQ